MDFLILSKQSFLGHNGDFLSFFGLPVARFNEVIRENRDTASYNLVIGRL